MPKMKDFWKEYDSVAKKTDKAVRLGKAVGRDMSYFGDSGTQRLLDAGHAGVNERGKKMLGEASSEADSSIRRSIDANEARRKRLIDSYATRGYKKGGLVKKAAPAAKKPAYKKGGSVKAKKK